MKEIETARFTLRKWTLDDAEACYKHTKNPNIGPHAGWKPHESIEESRHIIKIIFLPNQVWAIVDKESQEIIGCVGLEPDQRRPGVNSRELGYWLAEEFWGKGIMPEAAAAVVNYGFDEMNLDIVAVCTGPDNKRSQSVIGKCGFHYDGTLRRAYKTYDGSVRDSLCYSLLKEEWGRERSLSK